MSIEIQKYAAKKGEKKYDFDNIDINQLALIYKTGTLESLPQNYQEYFSLMELCRGLTAKMIHADKIITEAGIIKMLQLDKGLSFYQAKRLYADSINFFYTNTSIGSEAFSNLYASKLDVAAALALDEGKYDDYARLIKQAAELRGCFKEKTPEIPKEMLRKPVVIYTTDVADLGLPEENITEIEKMIDDIHEISEVQRNKLKMELGAEKFDIVKAMAIDTEYFEDIKDDDKKN